MFLLWIHTGSVPLPQRTGELERERELEEEIHRERIKGGQGRERERKRESVCVCDREREDCITNWSNLKLFNHTQPQVQTAIVAQDEGTVVPSTRLGPASPVNVGTMITLTSTSCTWKALTSWKGGTTIVVTLATKGWSLGASRLTVQYVGNTATCPDVVSFECCY